MFRGRGRESVLKDPILWRKVPMSSPSSLLSLSILRIERMWVLRRRSFCSLEVPRVRAPADRGVDDRPEDLEPLFQRDTGAAQELPARVERSIRPRQPVFELNVEPMVERQKGSQHL